jgi:DNA-binding MarR family transcriptional regulator
MYDASTDLGKLRTEATTSLLGYRLRRAQLNVFQKFNSVFETMRLRPAEYSVLVLVADNPGQKQTAIAEVLGIKRANFVPLLHGLEQRDLVERRPSAEDRRANALYLTSTGAEFLASAKALHDRMEDDLLVLLGGESQRRELFTLLDRLT